jgi:hypothetical protein
MSIHRNPFYMHRQKRAPVPGMAVPTRRGHTVTSHPPVVAIPAVNTYTHLES